VTATTPAVEANSAPIANQDSITVEQGGSVSTLSTGETSVLFNDSDAERDSLTVEVVTEPVVGILTLNADGTFTYQHDGRDSTTDSFTYRASDGQSESVPTTVAIQIIPLPNSRLLYLPVIAR